MESPLVYWQSHYQKKCPIYQNSKAVRDMVLLLMVSPDLGEFAEIIDDVSVKMIPIRYR